LFYGGGTPGRPRDDMAAHAWFLKAGQLQVNSDIEAPGASF
jgi:hypothetical protein